MNTLGLNVRFQADADLNEIILLATIRREPEIDFQTAIAAELAGVNDLDVLAKCAEYGRVLVTHDRKTMPRHFAEFIAQDEKPGSHHHSAVAFSVNSRGRLGIDLVCHRCRGMEKSCCLSSVIARREHD